MMYSHHQINYESPNNFFIPPLTTTLPTSNHYYYQSPLPEALLNKRKFENHIDSPYKKDIQKKFKISIQNNSISSAYANNFESFPHQTYQSSPDFSTQAAEIQDSLLKDYLYKTNQSTQTLKSLQNFQNIMGLRNRLQALQDAHLYLKSGLQGDMEAYQAHNIMVKQENDYENFPIIPKLEDQESLNEKTQPETPPPETPKKVKKEKVSHKEKVVEKALPPVQPVRRRRKKDEKLEDPALFEFTRVFDDMDLRTMFEYLYSGKEKDVFLRERKVRVRTKRVGGKRKNKKDVEEVEVNEVKEGNEGEINSQ